MNKAQTLSLIEKVNNEVKALATGNKIPDGSEKEVFLLLLDRAFQGQAFNSVDDV